MNLKNKIKYTKTTYGNRQLKISILKNNTEIKIFGGDEIDG